MASITKLKTSGALTQLSPREAFNLSRAQHHHLVLGDLLRTLYAQAHSLLRCVGLRFRNPTDKVDLKLGEAGPHSVTYQLNYQERNLGELVLWFRQTITRKSLGKAEDLTALALSPISNALRHRRAVKGLSDEAVEAAQMEVSYDDGIDDTLLLISLDGFSAIRTRDGSQWAQALVAAMQQQIDEHLGEADGVFQIDEAVVAVLLPQTTEGSAMRVADKLHKLIARLQLRDGTATTRLTACMGLAKTCYARSAGEVMAQAREALRSAQHAGAGNVQLYRS